MSAIRIDHRKPPADPPVGAPSVPPESKWDTLPVLKEVIEAQAPSPDAPPALETAE